LIGVVGESSRAIAAGRQAVHRRGGREHDVLHAGLGRALQQVARRAGVVAVVLERILAGLRHDGVRGEVHDRVDVVLREDARHEVAITGVADDELAVRHRLAKAGGQVVERHDALAGRAELAHDVAADVAGAAGDENSVCHAWSPRVLQGGAGMITTGGRGELWWQSHSSGRTVVTA
jgi:hypothetical protein